MSNQEEDVVLDKDENSMENENQDTKEPQEESEMSSPYMLLPDTGSSEMRLVIEGSDETREISPEKAEVKLNLTSAQAGSQCCNLI